MRIVAINRQQVLDDYRKVARTSHHVDPDALAFAVHNSLQQQLKIALVGVVAMFTICVAFLAAIVVTVINNLP